MSVGRIDTRVCQQNAEYNPRSRVPRKLTELKIGLTAPPRFLGNAAPHCPAIARAQAAALTQAHWKL